MRQTLFLLLLVQIIPLVEGYAQQPQPDSPYRLVVKLEDAPFETLYLFEYTGDRRILIEGVRTEKNTWKFAIPDSISNDSQAMQLKVSRYDSISNSATSVRFVRSKDSTTTIVSNVGLDDSVEYIYGTYAGKRVSPTDMFVRTNGKDTLLTADLILLDFELTDENYPNADIMVRADEPYFSMFFGMKKDNRSHDDYVAWYASVAQRHPDSYYLMQNLATNLLQYQSKDDIRAIYNSLSPKHKESVWAKNIERFLAGTFVNRQLTNLQSGSQELIVQDSSKYNLVIFSASWCVPCIKEIPLLKEMYRDLREQAEFTYITIDQAKDIPKFSELVEQHDIPWRSMYSIDATQHIMSSYYVESIPHIILVSPQGEMDFVEVRDEAQRTRLYDLLNVNTPTENI